MARNSRGSGLTTAGQFAGAAGMYRAGHFLRGAGHAVRMFSNVFDSGAGGGAAAGGAADAAALGAAAAGAAVAIGGLMVAVKAMEIGFKTFLFATNELIQSVTTLGGAKGLSAMLTESVTNQKLLNFARMNVAPEERLGRKEMLELASKAAEDARAGGFDRAEWLKAMGQFGILSGSQKNIDQDFLKFMGGMSLVAGSTPTGMMEVAARLKAQNPQLTNQGIESIMLGMHGVGLAGAFSPSELPDASKLWQLAPRIAGTPEEQFMMVASLGSLMKKGGAQNLNMAATWINRIIQGGTVGHIFKHGAGGEITNFESGLETLTTTPFAQLPKSMMAAGKEPALIALREQVNKMAGVGEDDFTKEANEKRRQVIKNLTDESYAREQLTKDIEESMTPQERFRAAFNRIADNLEDEFLPVMKDLEPVVEQFADMIADNKDQIAAFFEDLATKKLPQFVHAIPSVITILGALGMAVGNAVLTIAKWVGGMPGSVEEAKAQQKKVLEKDAEGKTALERQRDKTQELLEKSATPEAIATSKQTEREIERIQTGYYVKLLENIDAVVSGKAFDTPASTPGTRKRRKIIKDVSTPTKTVNHNIKINFAQPPPPPPSRSHGAN